MEPQNAAPEDTVDDRLAPRADSEGLCVGPGDVPEGDDGRFRQPLPDHAGQQREVIVLDEHDGVGGLRFAHHRVGEPAVDGDVGVPVRSAEDRARVRDVAQGPQAAVREPVVITGFLLLGEPDAPDPVGGPLGRHHDVVG